MPLDVKKSKYSITNFFKKEQEVKEASIVPVKRSRTSDDEMDSNMKKKVQRSDLDVPSFPVKKGSSSTPSAPTRTLKKSLKSISPRKQTPKKKKVDDVKENEKITKYFTSSS
jgi:hypothetical protein